MPSLTAPPQPTKQNKLYARIELAKRHSAGNFDYFIHEVFSRSFAQDEFISGEYIHKVAAHLQDNNYTIDVTGRNHFKSTRLYADLMWAMFTDEGSGFEAHYFSYAHELAAYHLKKVKRMVKDNPYFYGIIDQKPTSESIIDFSWDGKTHMTVTPSGLLSFKRGIHAERIYVDDPLRDPENKLAPTSVLKVNNIIRQELLQFVKKGGICRIVGTPQTNEDFFFDEQMENWFNIWITPAIIDEPNKIALWPEWTSYDELQDIRRTLGDRIFNPEYMASPVYSEDSYINRDKLLPLCTESCYSLTRHPELDNKIVLAGFDIGKKVHPSHLAVWVSEGNGEYRQIFSKWMDGWEYVTQLKYLTDAIELFNINRLRYDNTRGEFEIFVEQGLANRAVMEPMVLNLKNQNSMAANMGAIVDRGDAAFINEPRQINQVLAVTNDLDAMSGPEGHGDSFWSNAMALYEKRQPQIRWL